MNKDVREILKSQLSMDVEARLVTLVSWIAMGAMVFGGIVPFIPQYRKIKLKRSTEGFSTFVCLVLLLANIMRILFWVGKRYEYPLLAQSVVMVIAMIALMHLCVKVEREVSPGVARRISDYSSIDYFWKWTEFSDYILFITLFTVFGGVVTLVLRNVQLYVELLGFASLMTEAMLGVPQFWKNFQMKSTSGMSVQMVLLWFSGDMFKTTYFIVRHSPAQFWVCGGLQVTIDVLILLQILLYRDRRVQLIPKGSTRTTKISLP